MPMVYHTIVGHMSSGLSGGQQQRVLLARALYRRPKILILDEATSHLDLRRESLVNAAVRNLTMTRIIVAHRPQTLELADRVVHLQHGRIAPPIGPVPGGTGSMAAPSRQGAVVA
jgi:ATP-binding cassette subfamily B protein RaxB